LGTLTVLDFSSAASRASTQRHWFAINAVFTGLVGEDFRFIALDTNIGAGWTGINAAGSTTANSKFRPNSVLSPGTGEAAFSFAQDNGNDLQAIFINQTVAFNSFTSQIGEPGGELGSPARLGYFTLQFPSNFQGATSVSLSQTTGSNFSFWTNNQTGASTTSTTTDAGVTGGSFQVAAVPEPASIGLIAGGAAMLLGRRRRQMV